MRLYGHTAYAPTSSTSRCSVDATRRRRSCYGSIYLAMFGGCHTPNSKHHILHEVEYGETAVAEQDCVPNNEQVAGGPKVNGSPRWKKPSKAA